MQKYINNVQDTFGNAIGSVTVTIRDNPGGGVSTIYSDNSLTGKSNPFTNDSDGEFFFYAADGRYDIELTGPITETNDDVLLQDTAGFGPSFRILTDIVTATPPTTEAVTGSYQIWDLDETDQLANIGFVGDHDLRIRNQMRGGEVELTANTAAGVEVFLLHGDPDAFTDLYGKGVRTLRVDDGGVVVLQSEGNTDTEVRQLQLQYQDGTLRGFVGHNSNGQLLINQEIDGREIYIQARDAGSVLRRMLDYDPDASLIISGDTGLLLRVNHTESALLASANGACTIYYNNIQKIRTADQTASQKSSGGEVLGPDGVFYGIGLNVLPRETISGGDHVLDQEDQGKSLFYNEATARSLNLNNDSAIPVDALFHYRVGSTGGVLTGDGGTNVVISWWNGTGYTDTSPAGNMTIGEGAGTIWKEASLHYYIDGPNLS